MKPLRRTAWILCTSALLALISYGLWKWLHPRHKPRVWPGYTIKIPAGHTIHGIDVSRYQQEISWQLVKQMRDQGTQMRFAFVRATCGDAIADPAFETNWEECDKAGLVRGAYHFFDPGQDALTQADFFINQVALKAGDLPPVLDVETIGGIGKDSLCAGIDIWLKRVGEYYGTKPIVYCNIDFYKKYLRGATDDYPLWIAHYYTDTPGIDRSWVFWQHNDRGHVNGIEGFVDFDTFNGDSTAFELIRCRNQPVAGK